MADNIEESDIDFDQLESEHKRMLEKVKLDTALTVKEPEPKEVPKTDDDMIKLPSAQSKPKWNKNDTSTWSSNIVRIQDEAVPIDEFDSIVYDPYDIGSGNTRFMLGKTDDIWEAHAWVDSSDEEKESQKAMDKFLNGSPQKGKTWDTASRQWVDDSKRPLSQHSVKDASGQREEWIKKNEEDDILPVIHETTEEIKDMVSGMSGTIESLDSEVTAISSSTTFTSNNVVGMNNRIKTMEKDIKDIKREMESIKGYLEIIVQYYTGESSEEEKKDEEKDLC